MEALDPVRRYVTIGEQPSTWGYSRRRLYAHDALFRENSDVYEVLHEFDFVYTEDKRLFFFLAIFGEEYGIDMSDPDPASCFDFREQQNGGSPSTLRRASNGLILRTGVCIKGITRTPTRGVG
ncbi:hypothetical protein [Rhizobium giardinii]|uniref:Uncharacterized protein n=1 Tax=Rhizobium giardinii TaxID=56731 RepID=A0A7W8UBN5_9HYPH|nr:hypothetical protein [Rhizobium giardinii]MBB5536425.1 hypothetical protein [Rhizobium giardinii]